MKYIAFLNSNKRVMKISDTPIKNLSVLMTQSEVEELPAEYDFLTVDNVKENTNENGTYYTCDLVANFITLTTEQVEKQKQRKYEKLVEQYIRQKYSQDQVEAILNNYLSDMENETYKSEFLALQEYRAQCKARAKQKLNILR